MATPTGDSTDQAAADEKATGAAESKKADESTPDRQPGKPDWADWAVRSDVSLRDAVCLVLNLQTSRKFVGRLLKRKDDRVKRYGPLLKTLKQHQRSHPLLRATKANETRPDLTEISLRNFIEWLKTTQVLGRDKPPAELLNLRLLGDPTAQPPSDPVLSPQPVNGTDKKSRAKIDPKVALTMARVLLAMSMEHYRFDPFKAVDAASKAGKTESPVYAPLAKLCAKYKFDRPVTGEAVKDVLLAAIKALDNNELSPAVDVLRSLTAERAPK